LKHLLIGEKIRGRDSEYLIVEFVGEGGMAHVYKAVDTDTGEIVAIKVLERGREDKSDLYKREFLVLRGLMHQYIIKLYDMVEWDRYVFVIMEFLPGGSLKDKIKAGADVSHLAKLVADVVKVGAALDYAHAFGVIHRDVKPSNVLYDSDTEPRLTDFGIAVSMFTGTVSGKYAGTPAYMSPEQIRGEPLDPRTDIYQLGLMLFEVMTGRLPFDPDNSQAFVRWIDKGLNYEPSKVFGLPKEFDAIFERALAVSREDRYRRARDFAVDVIAASRKAGIPIDSYLKGLSELDRWISGIRVITRPSDAVVHVDGMLLGFSPVDAEGVFPGPHRVEVKMPMFETATEDIWLEPESFQSYEYTLAPAKKKIVTFHSASDVKSVGITAAGVWVLGGGSLTLYELDSGRGEVSFSLPDGEAQLYTVGMRKVISVMPQVVWEIAYDGQSVEEHPLSDLKFSTSGRGGTVVSDGKLTYVFGTSGTYRLSIGDVVAADVGYDVAVLATPDKVLAYSGDRLLWERTYQMATKRLYLLPESGYILRLTRSSWELLLLSSGEVVAVFESLLDEPKVVFDIWGKARAIAEDATVVFTLEEYPSFSEKRRYPVSGWVLHSSAFPWGPIIVNHSGWVYGFYADDNEVIKLAKISTGLFQRLDAAFSSNHYVIGVSGKRISVLNLYSVL
jgi:hypothetical protein